MKQLKLDQKQRDDLELNTVYIHTTGGDNIHVKHMEAGSGNHRRWKGQEYVNEIRQGSDRNHK